MSIFKMDYNPEPDSYCKNKIKDELDLSNFATKYESKKQKVLIH